MILKRIIDILGASVLLIVSLPVWLISALVILVSDGPPVLFRGNRVGKQGRVFKALKFRTLPRYSQPLAHGLAKISPINTFTAFLRASHLDEIPQCLNVIRGDMSLIGPRPMPIERYRHLVQQDESWETITKVLPGLSGLNQVAYYSPRGLDLIRTLPGLDHLTTRRRLELDQYYMKHFSLCLDAKIIGWTFRYLLRTLAGFCWGRWRPDPVKLEKETASDD